MTFTSTAWQLEKRGFRTELGDINREIEVSNKELRMLNARIRKAKNELFSLPLAEAPTLLEVATSNLAWDNLNTQWEKIRHLKSMAETLNFITSNNITDMGDFVSRVGSMYEETRELSGEVKKIDRRLDTLALHLSHAETIRKYSPIIREYKNLSGRKRDDFYARYKNAIDKYTKSSEYMTKIMNGKTHMPVKTWEAEKKSLTSKRYTLCDRYYDLRGEIKVVERLRRDIEQKVKCVSPEYEQKPQQRKSKDVEL